MQSSVQFGRFQTPYFHTLNFFGLCPHFGGIDLYTSIVIYVNIVFVQTSIIQVILCDNK
jgi:hypothetical protein